jgi:hypothetical protein
MTVDRRKLPSVPRLQRASSERMLQLHQRRPERSTARSTLVSSVAVDPLVFSHPGRVSATSSPPWTPFGEVRFTQARVLRASGSGTVTIVIKVDAATIETLTITGTGTDSGALFVDVTVAPGEKLKAEVTGAGGSEDLTVVLG